MTIAVIIGLLALVSGAFEVLKGQRSTAGR